MRHWRPNADPRIRTLERRAKESGDPEAMSQWFWARQRAGGRDGFVAAGEELDWLSRSEQPRIEAAYEAEREANEAVAMEGLRSLHKRVRRSKRKDPEELKEWARKVVGYEAVEPVLIPFRIERDRIRDYWRGVADQILERRKELRDARFDQALGAPFFPGDTELEYRFRRTSTHQSVGYGADSYARLGAEGDVKFLQHMGLEARMEQDPGEPWGTGGSPRTPGIRGVGAYAWIRTNQGWRSWVKARSPLDVEILRARQEAWKDRDWKGYMEMVLGHTRR